MRHSDFKEHVLSYITGELDEEISEQFEMHFFSCNDCRIYLLQNRLIYLLTRTFFSTANIDEVIEASQSGRLQESFATGTAAVISPVGELLYEEVSYPINKGETGPLSVRLFEELQAIQYGRVEDPFGWRVKVG